MSSRHYFISGRVQGVGFRFAIHEKARALNLKGWVRNLRDGRVECLASGASEDLAEFEQFLGKGPPTARVQDLFVEESSEAIEHPFFYIRREGDNP